MSWKKDYKFWRSLLIIFILFSLGILFNGMAVKLNDCRMPVYKGNVNSYCHFSFQENSEINAFYFSDIFSVSVKDGVLFFSIGDVVLVLSLLILISYLIGYFVGHRKKLRREDGEDSEPIYY